MTRLNLLTRRRSPVMNRGAKKRLPGGDRFNRKRTGSSAAAKSGREHRWVTVVNPTNQQLLLQACDNCGVVKSENSAVKPCAQSDGQHLISGSMSKDMWNVG